MRRAIVPVLLYMNAGLIVWMARFLLAYVFTSNACTRGWWQASLGGISVVPLVLVISTLAASALLLPIVWSGFKRPDRPRSESPAYPKFVRSLAALIAGLAIVAMVWETLPVFTLPVCG